MNKKGTSCVEDTVSIRLCFLDRTMCWSSAFVVTLLRPQRFLSVFWPVYFFPNFLAICRCEYPSWNKISICTLFSNDNFFFLAMPYPPLHEVHFWFICCDVVSDVMYSRIAHVDFGRKECFLPSGIMPLCELIGRCCSF